MAPVVFKPGFRLNPAVQSEPIRLQTFFEHEQPVEVEIGCGKGKFLVQRAESEPGVNFIGIDIAWKWMKKGEKNREKRALRNLHFEKSEARLFLMRLPDRSVEAFHINFPDPWPKRRHRKRRILRPEILRAMATKLVSGGQIQIATDDIDYIQVIRHWVQVCGSLWKSAKEQKNQRIVRSDLETSYEMKWREQGKDLFYLELVTK